MPYMDFSPEIIRRLRHLLEVLDEAAEAHSELSGDEELIESWTPSDSHKQISCDRLTVRELREAQILKRMLKL